MKLKKLTSLMLIAALTFSLVACSQEGEVSEEGEEGEVVVFSTENSLGLDLENFTNLDYSEYFNEDGSIKGITALDYVTLADYSSLSFEEDAIVADEEYVQAQIQGILESLSTTEAKTEAVALGDLVNIDFVGSVDGVEFDGGSTMEQGSGAFVLGEGGYIPGFEDQIVGKKVGDTFDITVTFPDDYSLNADLAGKEAVFATTLLEASVIHVPEMNDEFVKENYGDLYTGVEDLTQTIRDTYMFDMQIAYTYETIMSSTVGEVPEELIEFQKLSLVNEISLTAQQYQLTLLEYLETSGAANLDELLVDYEESFISRSQEMLILQAIAEQEGFIEDNIDVLNIYKEAVDDEALYASMLEFYGESYLTNILLQQYSIEFVNKTISDNTENAPVIDLYTFQ